MIKNTPDFIAPRPGCTPHPLALGHLGAAANRRGIAKASHFSKPLPLGAHMPKPSSAIYDDIVRELQPSDHEPDEAPITVRLKARTTPEEDRAIASMLQTRVKGLCQLEAPGEEAG